MGNSEDKLISSILSEKRKRFPDFEVKEGLLCEKCKEKEVPDNFQLSGMKICRKCYNQEVNYFCNETTIFYRCIFYHEI